jgi:rRNA maturation endonuclease Nob1
MAKETYTTNDLKKLPEQARLIKIGLMIANELHNISTALQTKQKIRCKDCKKTYTIDNTETCVHCNSTNIEYLT